MYNCAAPFHRFFHILPKKLTFSSGMQPLPAAVCSEKPPLHCSPSKHLYAYGFLPSAATAIRPESKKAPAGHRVYDACQRLSEHTCYPCQTGARGYVYFLFLQNVSRYFPPGFKWSASPPGAGPWPGSLPPVPPPRRHPGPGQWAGRYCSAWE